MFYITCLSLLIYLYIDKQISLRKKVKITIISFLTMLGLSAFMLLPELEILGYSTRPLTNFNYSTTASLNPINLTTIIIPHLFGIPEIEINGNTGNFLYIGILPLIFIFLSLKNKALKIQPVFIFFLVGGLLFSLGKYLPFYYLILLIPGFSLFREPYYLSLISIFAGSFIAGQGFNIVLEKYRMYREIFIKHYKKTWKLLLRIIGLLSLVIALILPVLNRSFWEILITPLSFISGKPIAQLLLKSDKIKLLTTASLLNIAFLFIILVVFIEGFTRIRIKKLFLVFIASLTFLDLYFLNQSEFFTINKNVYRKIYTNNLIPKSLTEPNLRIASLSKDIYPDWNNFNRDDYLKSHIINAENILAPNRNINYEVASVLGFSNLIMTKYDQYLTNQDKDHIIGITDKDVALDNQNLAKAGANYILSDHKLFLDSPRFQLLSSTNYYLYQDSQARKRTFLLNDKGEQTGSALIINSSPNKISIEAQNPQNARLILLDNYYPGWEAKINGVKTQVLPFENTFRQIYIPAGKNQVIFEYKPKSFNIGLAISLVSTVIIFLYLIYSFRTRGN